MHSSVDTVFHLASPAAPADYLPSPVRTLRTGPLGTANVLEFAERCDARLVLASTSEVYSDPLLHPQPKPTGETSIRSDPRRIRRSQAVRRGVDVRIPADAVGRRRGGPDLRHLRTPDALGGRPYGAHLRRQALVGEPITVNGSGWQTRSLCYVEDTVDALITLAMSDCPGPINVGNSDELSVLHIAELIRDLAGGDHRSISYRPCRTIRSGVAPTSPWPANSSAGSPGCPSSRGLADTVEWFRGQLQEPIPSSVALQGN